VRRVELTEYPLRVLALAATLLAASQSVGSPRLVLAGTAAAAFFS
jgi:hypothetical protein